MTYLGKNKVEELDGDMQIRYQNFDRNLGIALDNNNDQAIVQNFLGRESCFSSDEKIRGAIIGRRSLGIAYYQMISEKVGDLNLDKKSELNEMMQDTYKPEESKKDPSLVR